FSLEIHSYGVRVVGGLGCVGKNKLFWFFWVGLCVGSNVLLKYGLYVVCHLSKWFTFSSLFNGHFLLCRVVIRLQLTHLYPSQSVANPSKISWLCLINVRIYFRIKIHFFHL